MALNLGGIADDVDGVALAARGTVQEPLLRRLHAEPYYALPAPKTTGRELFHGACVRDALAPSGGGTRNPVLLPGTDPSVSACGVGPPVRVVVGRAADGG